MKLRSSSICLTSALALLGCGSGASSSDDCSGDGCHLGAAGAGGALFTGGSSTGATSSSSGGAIGSGAMSGSGSSEGSGSAAGSGSASSGGASTGGGPTAPEPPNGFYQMEDLDRGVVAVKVPNGVFISWRMQGYE